MIPFSPKSQRLAKPCVYEFDIYLRAAAEIQRHTRGFLFRRRFGLFAHLRQVKANADAWVECGCDSESVQGTQQTAGPEGEGSAQGGQQATEDNRSFRPRAAIRILASLAKRGIEVRTPQGLRGLGQAAGAIRAHSGQGARQCPAVLSGLDQGAAVPGTWTGERRAGIEHAITSGVGDREETAGGDRDAEGKTPGDEGRVHATKRAEGC